MRFIWLVLFSCILNAQVIEPYKIIQTSGDVFDIVHADAEIIIATNNSKIEIYNDIVYEPKSVIEFPFIEDFKGERLGAKIYSVDKISDTYLAVVQTSGSFRELIIIKDGVKETVVSSEDGLMIKKAKFITQDKVLLALLSNELILFDLATKKNIYRTQVNLSHFSDFALNENKTLVATSDESGEVSIVVVDTGKIFKKLNGANVDNVYKVGFLNGKVLTAGQDRRAIVYDVRSAKFDRFNAPFLLYAGAFSPSGELGAWAFTQENDIHVFDLGSKSEVAILQGQKSSMNTIVFLDESTLISGSDDKFVMIWRLK